MKVPRIDAVAAALTLRALANESRLQIVLMLLEGEAAVAAIERALGLRQPNLSQQLGELREAGLVISRRESRSVIYSLAGPAQQRLVAALAHGFDVAGAAPLRPAQIVVQASRSQSHLGAVFARILAPE